MPLFEIADKSAQNVRFFKCTLTQTRIKVALNFSDKINDCIINYYEFQEIVLIYFLKTYYILYCTGKPKP